MSWNPYGSETRSRRFEAAWSVGSVQSQRRSREGRLLWSLAYLAVRAMLGLAVLAARSGRSKDLEIMVLRHELAVLRRRHRPCTPEVAGSSPVAHVLPTAPFATSGATACARSSGISVGDVPHRSGLGRAPPRRGHEAPRARRCRVAAELGLRDLPRPREHRERDREVVPGSLLTQAGGREVDRNAPARERELGGVMPLRTARAPPSTRGRVGRRSRARAARPPTRRPPPRRGAARGRGARPGPLLRGRTRR
jgi:hypothetical protein